MLGFRFELNAKSQLQQEINCVLLSNYKLPRGAQHRQATEKADPKHKIIQWNWSSRREPARSREELHSSCFQAASICIDHVRNSCTNSWWVGKLFLMSLRPIIFNTLKQGNHVWKPKGWEFNFLQRWKNNCPFGCLSGNQNTYTILLCRALSCCDCKADKQPWHHCQKILIHNRFQYRLKDRAHQPGTHKVALLPFHM